MSRELYTQTIGPLNKGVNQQANSFVLPGFSKTLENANCDLVEGLKKRLASVPLRQIDGLTRNVGTSIDAPCGTGSGSPTLTPSTPGDIALWAVGDSVTGTGIPSNTTITSIAANSATVTMSANATATGTVVIAGVPDLTAPYKWDEAWYYLYNRSDTERFLLVIGDDSSVITQSCTTVSGSNSLTMVSPGTVDLRIGAGITGTGIPAGSTIVSFTSTKIVISSNATTSATNTMTIEAPKVFVTGLKDLEPISGILPTVVPAEQVFANLTAANTAYFRGSGRARDRFRATSFQDYVFVTNIQKKVEYNSLEALTRFNIGFLSSSYQPIKAQIQVKLVDYQCLYKIQVKLDDGTTITGSHTTDALAAGAISTQTIAEELRDALNTADTGNKLTFSLVDSQILIGLDGTNAANRYIQSFVASDARGDTLMSGFSNQITSIVDLPGTSWEGYTVLVAPDGSADQSSYYLRFDAENTTTDGTFGRGAWEEVGGWGTKGTIESTTMPHCFLYYRKKDDGLIKFTVQPFSGQTYTDGTTSIKIADWTKRLAGDDDPNKNVRMEGPSFVTSNEDDPKYITDIVFFKNRLGFISGENIILSEAGSYYNFWIQSALQVTDTVPIDLTAVSNDVAVLNYALQQQDELVLFSNENQFRMYSGDNVTFSPETASVGRISSISMEAYVRHQQVGPQVIFPVKEGDYTGLHTFITTDRTVGINLGQTAVITETVPKYIPKKVDSLAVSRTDQYLVALSQDDPDSLYVYQFFWEASGGSLTNKQNAWSKWTFPNKSIHWCDFIEGTLLNVVKYTENSVVKYYLEGINASRPPQDEEDLFLLDRQLASTVTTDLAAVTRTWSNLTNKTTIGLPYYTVNPSQFVIIKEDSTDANESEKRWVVAANVPAGVNSFVLDSLGDYSTTGKANLKWVFGEKYTFKFEPPQLMPYSKTATDNTFIGSRTGRLQLRYLDLYYNDARYFTINVTPDFRSTSTYEFDRRDPLNANIVLNQASSFDESKFRAYIQSKNDQVTIEVVNDSIDQAKFVALEWTGLYYDVARKFQ